MSPEPAEMRPEAAEPRPAPVEPRPESEMRPEPVEGPISIDWGRLRAAAIEASRNAYAPYSHFPVGAAALVDDGRVVTGCNVENASYGVTLCAECGLVSQLHASGGGRLVAVVCVDGVGGLLMPCGRCRQLLWEHGGVECLIETPTGILSMSAVLPQAFGADTLARRHRES
jgi:cytidine deaminase